MYLVVITYAIDHMSGFEINYIQSINQSINQSAPHFKGLISGIEDVGSTLV